MHPLQYKGFGLGYLTVGWEEMERDPDGVQVMLSQGLVVQARENYGEQNTVYTLACRSWEPVRTGHQIPHYDGWFLNDKFSHFVRR